MTTGKARLPSSAQLGRITRPSPAVTVAGPPASLLRVDVRREDGADVVELSGELDIATAPQLAAAIDRLLISDRNRIVVDLDDVTFFDAAAIEALITTTCAVAVSGGTLHVTENPRLMLLLRFTCETHRLNVHEAMQEGAIDPPVVDSDLISAPDPVRHPLVRPGGGTAGELAGVGADAQLPSLIQRSADGDEAAFVALYDATAARAYGLALRVLPDALQAAEVVQDAYVHLWTHAACFQTCGCSPIAWILTTVHRGAVSRVRLIAARAASGPSRVQTATCPASSALDDCSSFQRQAVELAYFEGYTHTRIDEMVGLSAGTARLRIRDGLLELRDQMRIA